MIAALVKDFHRAVTLLVIWSIVAVYNAYTFIRDHFGEKVSALFEPIIAFIIVHIYWFKV